MPKFNLVQEMLTLIYFFTQMNIVTDAWDQLSIQAHTGLLHNYFFTHRYIFSKKKCIVLKLEHAW